MSQNNGSNQGLGFAPPATPTQQNEYSYNNGVLSGSRVYNPKQNGYVDNSYLNPGQQQTQTTSQNGLNSVLGQVGQAANMSPEALQKGVDAYTAPQTAALDRTYNTALGQSQNDAASLGMSNSVGFNKNLADNLVRNKAQGDADIAAGGEQMRYQLPNMALQPLSNASNIYNSTLGGTQIAQTNNMAPSFSGSQASNNFSLGNYQNQLNAFNNSFQGNLNRSTGGTSGFLGSYMKAINPLGF